MIKNNFIEIYTDGATSYNGKSNSFGGWAYDIYINNKVVSSNSKGVRPATNQRMELLAIIKGLEDAFNNFIKDDFYSIKIYTDSAYCQNCYKEKWWINWKKNNWLNASKKPVANKDLWEKLIPHFENSNIELVKVKGHDSDWKNIRVDAAAVAAKIEIGERK